MKRTLFFQNQFDLRVKNRQLEVTDIDGSSRIVAIEDVGFIVLEHPRITISQSVIGVCLDHGIAIVFCNESYLPNGMVIPFDGNHIQSARMRVQQSASEPLKKNLWMQTIQAKLINQAKVLDAYGATGDPLRYKSRQVRSGDPSNEEAKGARVYWKQLFGTDFKRERHGKAPNAMLNYGYAILRAACARAITGTGLHPTFGIFHKNKYNSYCLADDLMEPYRAFVDLLVLDWIEEFGIIDELTTDFKAHMLGVLSMDTILDDRQRPLSLALSETTASLALCYASEAKKIKYPEVPKYDSSTSAGK